MKYPDDIDFFFILENHGWSTCYIYVGGRMYELGLTHVFENPIGVLLESLAAMLEGATEVAFKWHDEPGEYNWKITRNPIQQHKVNVSITGCLPLASGRSPKLETLNFEVKLKLFCICVLRQMEKIRDLMTEKSFKEHRAGQFPYHSFERFHGAFMRALSQPIAQPEN